MAAEGGRAKVKNITCFRCRKKGHYANKCEAMLSSGGSENTGNGEEDENETATLTYTNYKDTQKFSYCQ
eukprot:14335185-Ditylum_brightwellii.AAC.1